jgi:hypothetical protein
MMYLLNMVMFHFAMFNHQRRTAPPVTPSAARKSFATVVLAALSAVGAPVRRRGKEPPRAAEHGTMGEI